MRHPTPSSSPQASHIQSQQRGPIYHRSPFEFSHLVVVLFISLSCHPTTILFSVSLLFRLVIYIPPSSPSKMLYKSLVASALCAVALSAPTIPSVPQAGMKVISDYFNLLATKVAASKVHAVAPICDLGKAVLPIACASSSSLTTSHTS